MHKRITAAFWTIMLAASALSAAKPASAPPPANGSAANSH